MLPSVIIEIQNGNLGFTPSTEDGVAALIIVPDVVYGSSSDVISQIFSLAEAEALGITEANDTAYLCKAWKHIKDFYTEAGEGAEFWFSIRNNTVTIEDVCDPTNEHTNSMINLAKGRIKLLGITRTLSGGGGK